MSEEPFATRLNYLIDYLGMNKKTFAESINVSQPLITHLCAGRNNPSLEIIQKILIYHSEINPNWLILGDGPVTIVKNKIDLKPIIQELEQLDQLIVNGNQYLFQAVNKIREIKSIAKLIE